jgi:hypothetical protein
MVPHQVFCPMGGGHAGDYLALLKCIRDVVSLSLDDYQCFRRKPVSAGRHLVPFCHRVFCR